MSGVHQVLNYAGCFTEAGRSVDKVSGWEAGLRNGLRNDPLYFLVVFGKAEAIPTRYNQNLCAPVKVDESHSRHAKFP